MEFTSFDFGVFLTVTFALHWLAARWGATGQNLVLLAASIVFYGLADPRFLLLLLLSALVNYRLAIAISKSGNENRKRLLFRIGIATGLVILCFFKYFDFFQTGLIAVLKLFGSTVPHEVLAIALPLGISFYSFQMLGYLISVHNEEMEPCTSAMQFFTYVLFFPKVMAGPIERAQRFLPQIEATRSFSVGLATDGMRQILWGLFAKIVLADNASRFVDVIFQQAPTAPGSTLMVGATLYILQIYCDFSGYSNIALGISKLFGIRLMSNFSTPFFATNIGDFWRRWHISLTSWMVDHVYTPLSFVLRSMGRAGTLVAITATYLAVAIWHNAHWTNLVFGLLQTVYFLPLALSNSVNRPSVTQGKGLLPSAGQLARMIGMFTLMTLSFVLLRAKDLGEAGIYYLGLLKPSILSPPTVFPTNLFCIAPLFIGLEWVQRSQTHALEDLKMAAWLRWSLYAFLLFTIILMNSTGSYQFIYFQY